MRWLLFLGALALIVYLLWPVIRLRLGLRARGSRQARDELVKDPVCQTYVLRSRAVRREVGGSTQYYCSRECAARAAGLRGES